jgi:hypothetical protein
MEYENKTREQLIDLIDKHRSQCIQLTHKYEEQTRLLHEAQYSSNVYHTEATNYYARYATIILICSYPTVTCRCMRFGDHLPTDVRIAGFVAQLQEADKNVFE